MTSAGRVSEISPARRWDRAVKDTTRGAPTATGIASVTGSAVLPVWLRDRSCWRRIRDHWHKDLVLTSTSTWAPPVLTIGIAGWTLDTSNRDAIWLVRCNRTLRQLRKPISQFLERNVKTRNLSLMDGSWGPGQVHPCRSFAFQKPIPSLPAYSINDSASFAKKKVPQTE